MKTILFMLRKEFLQIFRNKQMLPIIFVMPFIQLIILVNAATFEIKDTRMYIIDNDYSSYSFKLKQKFSSSPFFKVITSSNSDKLAENYLASNKVRMILKIPKYFEKNIVLGLPVKVQFIINSEDGAAAGIISSYSNKLLFELASNISPQIFFHNSPQSLPVINIRDRFWYNPELNYKLYMVPGILGILITIIAFFLSSLNIVREKEIGTIEQLNVTPIRKHQFIIGKLLPFLILALFELAFGLILAFIVYGIKIEGNIFLIFGLSSLYIIAILGFGLLISTVSSTQQQALFVVFFFNILLILLGGLFTSIDSMPGWAQVLAFCNPFAHFIEILRRVMIKGAGFNEVRLQAGMLTLYSVIMISLAMWRYRKTAG
jgi:ABC-2 type transport system permease protein